MTLKSEVDQLFFSEVESGNINYLSAPAGVVTPASGAPGAYVQLLADAAAPIWWFCAFILGNLSGAAATRFDYGIARDQDGGGTDIAVLAIIMEAALAIFEQTIPVPYPVRVDATGAAAQQRTASTETLDVAMTYALAVGS